MSHTREREDSITEHYPLWRDLDVDFKYKRRKAARIGEIVRETGAIGGLAVELGVGPGGIAAHISRMGIHVVGVDLSPDALSRAREHCRGSRVSLLRGSGFSLPFLSQSVRLLYAPQVLHLFDDSDRAELAAEAHRVLAPGGHFIFDMKNRAAHIVRYLKADARKRAKVYPGEPRLAHMLREAGFATVETRPGVLPGLSVSAVPDVRLFKVLTHTRFYIARK
jgi:ubiquinone/menaquinone biosynthesis C-methylase UbiE